MTIAPHPLPSGEPSSAARAVDLATAWVRWYTSRVDDEAAEVRRAEIASDLWEQVAESAPARSVGASITWRVVAGIPADLSWMHQRRALARGRATREKESPMNAVARLVTQWWWIPLAVGIAVFYGWIAVGNLAEPGMPYLDGAVLAIFCAALIGVGAVLRVSRPLAGGLLVVAGVGPAVLLFWAPVVAIVAGVAVLGAVLDLVVVPAAQRRIDGVATAGRALAVLGCVVATIAPLALGVFPGLLVTGVIAVAILVGALLRRSGRVAATGATA